LNDIGQPIQLTGTENEIDMRCPSKNESLILLRHTTENAENGVGISFLPTGKPSEGTVNLILGVLADTACIEQNHIGVALILRRRQAESKQSRCRQLTVQHVHLATKRFDVKCSQLFIPGLRRGLCFLDSVFQILLDRL
jgi:hypothetical protein